MKELTKPHQSRHRLFNDPSLPEQEIKTIRLMFALSILQFCINNTSNTPFQIALTETVVCHGGQQNLVRILNSLGAAVSKDTADRLATQVVVETRYPALFSFWVA